MIRIHGTKIFNKCKIILRNHHYHFGRCMNSSWTKWRTFCIFLLLWLLASAKALRAMTVKIFLFPSRLNWMIPSLEISKYITISVSWIAYRMFLLVLPSIKRRKKSKGIFFSYTSRSPMKLRYLWTMSLNFWKINWNRTGKLRRRMPISGNNWKKCQGNWNMKEYKMKKI